MKTYDEISDAAKDRGAFVHGEKPTEGRVHYRVGFIDGAKWMQELDQWIPVTERLPDNLTPVNVWANISTSASVGGRIGDDWYILTASSGALWTSKHDHIKITHWQPLPGAPSSVLPESQSDSE